MRIDNLPGGKSVWNAPYKDAPPHTKILLPGDARRGVGQEKRRQCRNFLRFDETADRGKFGLRAWPVGVLSIGVSVAPGATTLTVTPRGANSIAQERARPTMAALLAAY